MFSSMCNCCVLSLQELLTFLTKPEEERLMALSKQVAVLKKQKQEFLHTSCLLFISLFISRFALTLSAIMTLVLSILT